MSHVETFDDALVSLKLHEKSPDFQQRVYAALCNVGWKRDDNSDAYTCSWRYAGGLVSGLAHQGEGDYMEFYCSGGEGTVDPEVAELLRARGWVACDPDEAYVYTDPERADHHRGVMAAKRWMRDNGLSPSMFGGRPLPDGGYEYTITDYATKRGVVVDDVTGEAFVLVEDGRGERVSGPDDWQPS